MRPQRRAGSPPAPGCAAAISLAGPAPPAGDWALPDPSEGGEKPAGSVSVPAERLGPAGSPPVVRLVAPRAAGGDAFPCAASGLLARRDGFRRRATPARNRGHRHPLVPWARPSRGAAPQGGEAIPSEEEPASAVAGYGAGGGGTGPPEVLRARSRMRTQRAASQALCSGHKPPRSQKGSATPTQAPDGCSCHHALHPGHHERGSDAPAQSRHRAPSVPTAPGGSTQTPAHLWHAHAHIGPRSGAPHRQTLLHTPLGTGACTLPSPRATVSPSRRMATLSPRQPYDPRPPGWRPPVSPRAAEPPVPPWGQTGAALVWPKTLLRRTTSTGE